MHITAKSLSIADLKIKIKTFISRSKKKNNNRLQNAEVQIDSFNTAECQILNSINKKKTKGSQPKSTQMDQNQKQKAPVIVSKQSAG